jgi:hypothetical protein
LRPTTNDLLTPSMSKAGTAVVAAEATGTVRMVVFSWSVRMAVTMDSRCVAVMGNERAAGLVRRFVGGPRGS